MEFPERKIARELDRHDDDGEDGEEADDYEAEDDGEEIEELTLNGAKGKLCDALETFDTAGSFATSGSLKQTADPRLLVDDHGPIQLPLKEEDAARVIAKSHQALFGHGTRTIADAAVRRRWELNHDQFYITNPAFW